MFKCGDDDDGDNDDDDDDDGDVILELAINLGLPRVKGFIRDTDGRPLPAEVRRIKSQQLLLVHTC